MVSFPSPVILGHLVVETTATKVKVRLMVTMTKNSQRSYNANPKLKAMKHET